MGAITAYIDVAQLVLYAFWIFFAGLIYYLHREDKREGYPLESDRSGSVRVQGWPPIPAPKTFRLRDGRRVHRPAAEREPSLPLAARPSGSFLGAPLVPTADALTAEIGPGGYALRADVPDTTVDGAPRLVPLRAAPGLGIARPDRDPRGLPVIGADGAVAGRVSDLWVDQAEMLFRYLEVELVEPGAGRVLLPTCFSRVGRRGVHVQALLAHQFSLVPRTRAPDVVTLLEEERIVARYGAGTLYAEPRRAEPLL